MKKWGGLTLALLVGCATGGLVRDVVLPARAAGNAATYGYKVYDGNDIYELGKRADPSLRGSRAIERGMNELGKTGWRFVQSNGYGFVFESTATQ